MDDPLDRGISWFYCCLHVAERTVLRQTCEGLVLTLFQGIPLAVWDAFWLVTSHNSDEYKRAFLGLYHLEIVTIEIDLVPTDVVRPRDGFLSQWVDYSLFVVSPAAACLEGCGQSRIR